MLKSIAFGIFSLAVFVLVAVGSTFLTGCSGTDQTTIELDMPPEQCIAGHHEACWCEGGTTGYQICRDDGMAYGHCQCPEATEPVTDAGAEASPAEDAASESDGNVVEPDAEADAEVDAKADAAANTFPFALTLNVYATDPVNSVAGNQSYTMARIEVCAFKDARIKKLNLRIKGGKTIGSNNTHYFSNNKLQNDTSQTFMGPKELNATASDSEARELAFADEFSLSAGHCAPLYLKSDLAEHSDAPGEYIGQSYQVQLHGIDAEILDVSDGQYHPIQPNDTAWFNQVTQWFEILCNPGTFVPCSCNDGSTSQTYCGVNYEPLACDCPEPLEGLLLYVNLYGYAPSTVSIGNPNADSMLFELCTSSKEIEITNLGFYLQKISTNALTQGSNSTRYFGNMRVKNFDMTTTISGPSELYANTGEEQPRRVNFTDPFTIPANTCEQFHLVASVSNQEDAPMELIGEQYQTQLIGLGSRVAGTTSVLHNENIHFGFLAHNFTVTN